MLGGSSKVVYAIALFASGQSSTITGTYAGQFIMQVITIFLFIIYLFFIISVIINRFGTYNLYSLCI